MHAASRPGEVEEVVFFFFFLWQQQQYKYYRVTQKSSFRNILKVLGSKKTNLC
jgi:hypothetical protein